MFSRSFRQPVNVPPDLAPPGYGWKGSCLPAALGALGPGAKGPVAWVTGSARGGLGVRTTRCVAVLHGGGSVRLWHPQTGPGQTRPWSRPVASLYRPTNCSPKPKWFWQWGGTNVIHAARARPDKPAKWFSSALKRWPATGVKIPAHGPSQADSDAGLETAKDME